MSFARQRRDVKTKKKGISLQLLIDVCGRRQADERIGSTRDGHAVQGIIRLTRSL
jgi:hypothetical protein